MQRMLARIIVPIAHDDDHPPRCDWLPLDRLSSRACEIDRIEHRCAPAWFQLTDLLYDGLRIGGSIHRDLRVLCEIDQIAQYFLSPVSRFCTSSTVAFW